MAFLTFLSFSEGVFFCEKENSNLWDLLAHHIRCFFFFFQKKKEKRKILPFPEIFGVDWSPHPLGLHILLSLVLPARFQGLFPLLLGPLA